MTLLDLFKNCLRVPYSEVGVSANYAFRRDGETMYIYFQDSKGAHDWKMNFDFPAKAYKRMGKTIWFAHRGFLSVWKEIEPEFVDIIQDKTIKKMIIAGYSHGAAIAMLCHEYVWFNRPEMRENLHSFGFASPRVFWGIKTKKLKERWKNFTVIRNKNDIFTHLPPSIFGFSHVGKLIKIGKIFKYSMFKAHFSKNILTELEIFEKNSK